MRSPGRMIVWSLPLVVLVVACGSGRDREVAKADGGPEARLPDAIPAAGGTEGPGSGGSGTAGVDGTTGSGGAGAAAGAGAGAAAAGGTDSGGAAVAGNGGISGAGGIIPAGGMSATGGASPMGGAAGGRAGGPCQPGEWKVETLSLASTFATPVNGVTQRLAIAVDGRNKLHLFFNTDVNNQVLYAGKPSDGAWSPAFQVQSGGWVGHGYMDLVSSSSSVVHLVFTSGDTGKSLDYDQRSSEGIWQNSPNPDFVYRAQTSGFGPLTSGTLALDPQGTAYVAYSVAETFNSPATLYLATKTGPTWQSTPVDAVDRRSPLLVIDAASTMHVVYQAGASGGLGYLSKPDGANAWTGESIAPNVAIFDQPPAALAVASGGVPHVLYHTDAGVWHAVRAPNATWSAEMVVANGQSGSLAVTPDGTVHALVLMDGKATYFRRPPGGKWLPTALGPAQLLGGRRTLVVDSTGLVHVVFMKDTTTKMHAFGCPGTVPQGSP